MQRIVILASPAKSLFACLCWGLTTLAIAEPNTSAIPQEDMDMYCILASSIDGKDLCQERTTTPPDPVLFLDMLKIMRKSLADSCTGLKDGRTAEEVTWLCDDLKEIRQIDNCRAKTMCDLSTEKYLELKRPACRKQIARQNKKWVENELKTMGDSPDEDLDVVARRILQNREADGLLEWARRTGLGDATKREAGNLMRQFPSFRNERLAMVGGALMAQQAATLSPQQLYDFALATHQSIGISPHPLPDPPKYCKADGSIK